MKIETYYDVGCDKCLRHMSTDFNTGMAKSSKQARQWAKNEGFKVIKGVNICPICLKECK